MSNTSPVVVEDNSVDGITLVTPQSAEHCNPRQQIDYADHRRTLVNWLLHLGKSPSEAEGYAWDTARRRAHDLDKFYRWVWVEQQGHYTTSITHDHADAYCKHLSFQDHSDAHRANVQKSLKCYFRWRDDEWDPAINFTASGGPEKPQDYLRKDERTAIREAALEYGGAPSYNSLTPDDRDRWKKLLARRFRKPATEVGYEDFQKANGFKIPSLVYTSLDLGLRPKEVGRAKRYWVDLDNRLIRIPASESTKNTENWEVPIRNDTARMLKHWQEERVVYDKYEDTDRLWLTRARQPYSSRSLKYLLGRLCEIANIDTANRKMSWYALRHSTGTYITAEKGVSAAAEQLRHLSTKTTEKYDHAPVEERREALEEL